MGKNLLQIIAVLAIALFMAGPLCAAPWGIVTTKADYYGYSYGHPDYDNETDNESLHTIDLGQTPPVVYGPFLSGELSPGRGFGAFDIAMLPGNKKALVATINPLIFMPPGAEASPSFMPTTSQISLIDLRNPTNPVLEDSIELFGEATDISITRDGKLAIVCITGAYMRDAVATSPSSSVVFINLKDFSYEYIYLGSGPAAVPAESGYGMYAQSVAISRKNIAIFTDYDNGAIHYGKINRTRDGFDSLRTIYLCEGAPDNQTECSSYPPGPVNVAISPNGRTALVTTVDSGQMFVFEITGKGDLIPGNPFILTGLPGPDGGQLSVDFASDKTAYVLSFRYGVPGDLAADQPDADGLRPDQLGEIKITGPGRAEYITARYNLLNSNFYEPIFGFETLSIFKRHALIGNNGLAPLEASSSPYYNPYYNQVVYIDLVTGRLTPVELNNYGVGTGVAIKP